jgi:DNA-binding CsgD family transcriptional regulator
LAADTQAQFDTQTIGDDWANELCAKGFCVIPDLLARTKLHALHYDLLPHFRNATFPLGDSYDKRTKRFGELLKRSVHVAALAQHPQILAIAKIVLGPYVDIHLNFTEAFEIWPGEGELRWGRTQDFWRGLQIEIECVLTVIWALKTHRVDNGAIFVWPGSHRSASNRHAVRSEPVAIEMDPGTALLVLGSTLTGASPNRSTVPCAGVNLCYSAGWLRSLENHCLIYTPEVARTFSAELAGLIGYPQQRPFLDASGAGRALLPEEIPGYSYPTGKHPEAVAASDIRTLSAGTMSTSSFRQSQGLATRGAPSTIDEIKSKGLAPIQLWDSYGLTKSETQVGQLLLEGAHAREISKIRQVSIETIRTQIKSVYSKAGVRCHTDFILKSRMSHMSQFGPEVERS